MSVNTEIVGSPEFYTRSLEVSKALTLRDYDYKAEEALMSEYLKEYYAPIPELTSFEEWCMDEAGYIYC